MSVKDHPLLALRSRFLQVLATYSDKPNISAIPLCEKTTAHWAWEMVRVACTHPMNPSQMNDAGRWSTVLSGSAGPVHVLEDPSEG